MQELILPLSYEIKNHLRQDSCRGCGKELDIIALCQVCDKPIQFRCKDCDQFLEEQLHYDCNFAIKLGR